MGNVTFSGIIICVLILFALVFLGLVVNSVYRAEARKQEYWESCKAVAPAHKCGDYLFVR